MATSSSDDSSAPDNFNVSSSNGGSENNFDSSTLKCPQCTSKRKRFHCTNCVKNGDFVHSSHHLSERFCEKQQKLRNLKASLSKCNDQCKEKLLIREKKESLEYKIAEKQRNIEILNKLLLNKNHELSDKKRIQQEKELNNRYCKDKLLKYADKVKSLKDFVEDRSKHNDYLKSQLNECHNELKLKIRYDAQTLITYIFPIKRIKPKTDSTDSFEISETVAALADATNTAYIRGKWVYSNNEAHHIIVDSSLPSNGDYSDYLNWFAYNKECLPGSTGGETIISTNPAYRIGAALTYTTQLINIISYILDKRLPHKVYFGDFCKGELNEEQFNRRIARLNSNIMYLAYTQNVNLNLLNVNYTLENILKLLDIEFSDFGRYGPVEPSNAPLDRSVDSQVLLDVETATESESDDENSHYDWESLPHIPSEETCPSQPSSTQQATSIAGGLVTSAASGIASLWRGLAFSK